MCENMPLGAYTGQEGSMHLHLGRVTSSKLHKCLPQQFHTPRPAHYHLHLLRRSTGTQLVFPGSRESLRIRQYRQQAHLELVSIPSLEVSSSLSP